MKVTSIRNLLNDDEREVVITPCEDTFDTEAGLAITGHVQSGKVIEGTWRKSLPPNTNGDNFLISSSQYFTKASNDYDGGGGDSKKGAYHHHHGQGSTSESDNGNNNNNNNNKNGRQCDNCGTGETPSWRRCPSSGQQLCNACGLYLRLHNRRRVYQQTKDGKTRAYHPIHLIDLAPDTELPLTRACGNCKIEKTPVWRRGFNGVVLCNACALFEKSHGGRHRLITTSTTTSTEHKREPQ